jgi:hypothetical protein
MHRPSSGGQPCHLLRQILPGKVTTSDDPSAYEEIKTGYASSFNRHLNPACFVEPTCAEDVAAVVRIAKENELPFAVKSGGHTFFASASNIEDGITIDLQHLDQVTPNADQTVSVGTGARWGNVYETLDPLNLTVQGGRIADVGVGGLLLSGGISYLHPQVGFACDNVRNYQVVTADGEILDVNQESHPDLYWALRGGGNNFGIVTRFDLDSIEHQGFWGGSLTFDITQLDPALRAFSQLLDSTDVKATSWFVVGYMASADFWVVNTMPLYADPVPLDSPPEIFQPFLALPSLQSTIRIAKQASFAQDSNVPRADEASAEWDITMKPDVNVIYYMIDQIKAWRASSRPFPDRVYLSMQILSASGLRHTEKRGGNPMGLGRSDTLLMAQLGLRWGANATAAESEGLIREGEAFVADLEQWSEERGLRSRYVYMNYAAQDQDVFRGYGEENREKMRQVARKYDQEAVFQKLMPGGKKLF